MGKVYGIHYIKSHSLVGRLVILDGECVSAVTIRVSKLFNCIGNEIVVGIIYRKVFETQLTVLIGIANLIGTVCAGYSESNTFNTVRLVQSLLSVQLRVIVVIVLSDLLDVDFAFGGTVVKRYGCGLVCHQRNILCECCRRIRIALRQNVIVSVLDAEFGNGIFARNQVFKERGSVFTGRNNLRAARTHNLEVDVLYNVVI